MSHATPRHATPPIHPSIQIHLFVFIVIDILQKATSCAKGPDTRLRCGCFSWRLQNFANQVLLCTEPWIEKGKDTGHRDVGGASAELHLGFIEKNRLCPSTPAILTESQHPSPCTVGLRKSVGLCEQTGHCHCVCAGVLVRTRVGECGGTRDFVAISVALTHTISDSGIVAVSLYHCGYQCRSPYLCPCLRHVPDPCRYQCLALSMFMFLCIH